MLLMHGFCYLKYAVSETTSMNEAVSCSAVYVIVALLSYQLTFGHGTRILIKTSNLKR